ncbi:MAG: deoxynucleoside kinase [bacterium]|nr:deoxynucleoside kinase [bacterium]
MEYAKKKGCFIVEGNIGAGKSTFLRLIKDYLNVQVVPEPHQKWQTVAGTQNLLEKFYQDTQRWAFTFQSNAFISRVKEQQDAEKQNPYAIQVLERSVFSDRYCFAKNCFELGYMNALEWKLYQEWFSWLVDNYATRPTGFIYLRTDPKICYQRLLKRNRHEEISVSLDYLQKLHDKHETWLIQKQGISDYLKDVSVLILECNGDFETNSDELKKHIQNILDFFTLHLGNGVYLRESSSLSL